MPAAAAAAAVGHAVLNKGVTGSMLKSAASSAGSLCAVQKESRYPGKYRVGGIWREGGTECDG